MNDSDGKDVSDALCNSTRNYLIKKPAFNLILILSSLDQTADPYYFFENSFLKILIFEFLPFEVTRYYLNWFCIFILFFFGCVLAVTVNVSIVPSFL